MDNDFIFEGNEVSHRKNFSNFLKKFGIQSHDFRTTKLTELLSNKDIDIKVA